MSLRLPDATQAHLLAPRPERTCPKCGAPVKSWYRSTTTGRVPVWMCYGSAETRYAGCGWTQDAPEIAEELRHAHACGELPSLPYAVEGGR